MNSQALKDKVAIIGMGCTKFGENFDQGPDDMIVEASFEAFDDAGVGVKDIQAAWLGTVYSGITGALLAAPLKTRYIPITRVENGCATGSDALRQACMGIVCGLYDIVLAVGVEKLKDSGWSGLPESFKHPVYAAGATAPGRWAMGATRYFYKYGLSPEEGKTALSMISVKSHYNGSLCPKAHFQRTITLEQAMNAPIIAWPLGLFDCCPTTDGAAAAVLCRADMADSFRKDYVLVRGFGLATDHGWGKENYDYDFSYLEATEQCAIQAYEAAGITNAREEIDIAQVHDCFSIAELLEYEALQFSPKGKASEDIHAGSFTLEGDLPIQTDGGLKSFGHPLGATGLRMIYECYKQLQGKVDKPDRQVKNVEIALAMPQYGHPGFLGPLITILTLR